MNEFHCSSPTCTKVTHLAVSPESPHLLWHLEQIGWTIEEQPGDWKPLIYCGRCKL